MIRLADPLLLGLIALPALALLWLRLRRRDPRPRMKYSAARLLGGATPTLRCRLLGAPLALGVAAAVLVIVGLARPQTASSERKRFSEGIDIMLVIDVSDSMKEQDFTPNRLEKAKEVTQKFIDGRRDDQIGVVIFARDTFQLCPLTFDYAALDTFVKRIDFDLVNGQGTGIGMGLANAVARLRDSPAKSKVAILLTDGVNNIGRIDPISAAEIAKQFNIRVYTIGVGSDNPGTVRRPGGFFSVPMFSDVTRLDVEQLTKIADMTGGQFFRATDDQSLENIYEQIDRMERTKIEISETHYFDEWGHYLALPALALLVLGLLLEYTWLRTFP